MYHGIVKKIVRDGFARLSKGDYEVIVKMFAPGARFRFVGDHAMGADLHDVGAIRQWFQRVLRLFPGIQFEVRDLKVSGMPWNTLIATQLAIHATLPDGRKYENVAFQIVRLSWGRIVEDYVCEDTHVLMTALKDMAQQGVTEAGARPIADAVV